MTNKTTVDQPVLSHDTKRVFFFFFFGWLVGLFVCCVWRACCNKRFHKLRKRRIRRIPPLIIQIQFIIQKQNTTHGDYEKLQILTYIWSFSGHGVKLALDILRLKARTKIKFYLFTYFNIYVLIKLIFV